MSKRTVIRGEWVVAHDGAGHRLMRHGVVVIDGNMITDVANSYAGNCDIDLDARGSIVVPGFIDTHVHAGLHAAIRLIVDSGRKDVYGQPFPNWRFRRSGAPSSFGPSFDDTLAARFTVAELLLNGVTTFVDVGDGISTQLALVDACEELGARAYLGPGYDSESYESTPNGRWQRTANPNDGFDALGDAVRFIQRYGGRANGRIQGILTPRYLECDSFELLSQTRQNADNLNVPIQIHAGYSVMEWNAIVERYGVTPIEFLASTSVLGPRTILGHANLLAETSDMNWAGGHDLDIIASSGSAVAHCPINLVRRGRVLDSLDRYKSAGVVLALGSDTYPRDMLMQMRLASYLGKIVSKDFTGSKVASVFDAATTGGANALGREDLGRLAPGCRADVTIIKLNQNGTLRQSVVRDPLHAIVECGIGDDVSTVLVDGVIRVKDRRIPGLDIPQLRIEAQRGAERYWDDVAEWDAQGRDAEVQCPWSIPLA